MNTKIDHIHKHPHFYMCVLVHERTMHKVMYMDIGCSDFLNWRAFMHFWTEIEIIWPNTKKVFFLFSCFVRRISYFCVKFFYKSLLRAKLFFSEIGLYGYLKNREFNAEFRSEGIIQKKMHRKKDNPKNCFSKKSQKKWFLGLTFFCAFFLNNFSRSEISIKFILDFLTPILTYFEKIYFCS